MEPITVKQFNGMGHASARSIHWTKWGQLGNLKEWFASHPNAYLVGFEVKGKISPFAIWIV